MNLHVKDMDESLAKDILLWQYEKPYDFYNNEIIFEPFRKTFFHAICGGRLLT